MSCCVAMTKAEVRCCAKAMQGKSYCYRHNPDIEASAKAMASASGGMRKAVLTGVDPVELRTTEGIISLIESNINGVRTGMLDPRISNSVVQNLNILFKLYELVSVDNRLRRLEGQAGIDSPKELIL